MPSEPSVQLLLCTLNAKYSHASFGLRSLLAQLGPRRQRTLMLEFTLQDRPLDVVERILDHHPRWVGFGVYIWNLVPLTEVVLQLKLLRPELIVILGGPEVSFEYGSMPIFQAADHLIPGEADLALPLLLDALESGPPPPKVLPAPPPDLDSIVLPYEEYTDTDLKERLIYVEASRGCPFRCEFCLSSQEIPVRAFPLDPFLQSLDRLLQRGARAFKFVDRTFNLRIDQATAILEFLFERIPPGFELHFEMIPDRLPPELLQWLARFPPGVIQLEIGIQTLDPEISRHISRPLKLERIEENLHALRSHTGAHTHADLIFGLPGDTVQQFGQTFDRLFALEPDEIQLGILKHLRGTPIARHARSFAMIYSPQPPYEVLQTRDITFSEMQRMKRVARYLDLFHNSGNFMLGMALVYQTQSSPFAALLQLCDWIWETTRQTHQFALSRLYRLLFGYLIEVHRCDPGHVARQLLLDYDRHGIRRERLEFLSPFVDDIRPQILPAGSRSGGRRRGGLTQP